MEVEIVQARRYIIKNTLRVEDMSFDIQYTLLTNLILAKSARTRTILIQVKVHQSFLATKCDEAIRSTSMLLVGEVTACEGFVDSGLEAVSKDVFQFAASLG